MLLLATVPALVALVGLFVYLASNGKAAVLGAIAFGCGLLVLVFVLAHEIVKLGPG
jgi:hypothetical protein